MTYGQTLIDLASKVCGSDAKLSRAIGVSTASMANMRSGKLKVSPEMAMLLAAVCGEDQWQAVARVMIENATATRPDLASRLQKAFVHPVTAGEAGMLRTSASAGATTGTESHDAASDPHIP